MDSFTHYTAICGGMSVASRQNRSATMTLSTRLRIPDTLQTLNSVMGVIPLRKRQRLGGDISWSGGGWVKAQFQAGYPLK